MINVTKSLMPSFEEYCNEIKDMWDSHWLTNMGAKHKRLEAALQNYLQVPNITLFTNGHLSLENIIAAYDFPVGAEVITTPFTFASTTHAIVRNELVPVFCDIDPEDYNIDVTKIIPLITARTVAIIPVHVFGNICKIEKIKEIADEYDLKVIYDAAHTFGETYKGTGVGNFGDASIFSFHATKVFNTVEGGCITYADGNLKQRLNDQKNFGIHGPESVEYIGGNAKMSEFHAAMGLCNLPHVAEEIEKRHHVDDMYRSYLESIPGIKLNAVQPDTVRNYAYFPVVFDGYKYTREDIYAKLKEQDIVCRKYFYPTTNAFPCYKEMPTAGAEKTPVAKYISDRILALPIYGDLPEDIIKTICRTILD